MAENKAYHITKRAVDGRWQVILAGGSKLESGKAKAIKIFDTQKEAIAYAHELADKQEAAVYVHRVEGGIRKE